MGLMSRAFWFIVLGLTFALILHYLGLPTPGELMLIFLRVMGVVG